MSTRLLGIVGTLWFFVALMLVFSTALFSPRGVSILLPERHPATWIVPSLLIAPPSFLAAHRYLSSKFSTPLGWVLAVILVLPVIALFLWLAAIFVGH